MTKIVVNYEYPYYSDMIQPKGFLGIDRRFHACFTYFLLCHKLKEKAGESIDDQIVYEGDAWIDKPYGDIARSVAMRYGLESPDDFLKFDFIRAVRLEAARQQLPRPHDEYLKVWPGKNLKV